MIRVDILRANHTFVECVNGTFYEGEYYIGRMSKDGKSYVVRSSEGYWIPLVRFTWAKTNAVLFTKRFMAVNKVYFQNYEELKV